MESLKTYRERLTNIQRDAFTSKYDKILDLLTIPRKEEITAFAHFYDHSLRCFLFQDFLLAPTLEEFNKILSSLKLKSGPYKMIGYTPTPKEMTRVLNIGISNLEVNLETRGNFKGFSRDYLDMKVMDFATAKKWDSLDTIMAILIYEFILLPSEEYFVDLVVVSVFLAIKVEDEDLIPSLLTDVNYTILLHHEKRGDVMLCCAPFLYKWFISHISKDISSVGNMNGYKWYQYLVALVEKYIIWYPQVLNREEMIISC